MGLVAVLRRANGRVIINEEEFELAGKLTGGSFVLGGLTMALMAVLPGIPRAHQDLLFALAALATVAGPVAYVAVPWHRSPQWVVHPFQALALALIATATASSGGSASPAWIYLLISGLYAAYFYRPRLAIFYLLVCVAVQSLPLIYDPQATHDRFLATLLIAAPVYVGLGVMINLAKRWVWAMRSRAQTLAAEQGAMRRVATAVVHGHTADDIYGMVAAEIGHLLRGEGAGILRAREDGRIEVAGAWATDGRRAYAPGTTIVPPAGGAVERALETGRPARNREHQPGGPLDRLGYTSSVVAPVHVGDRRWGVLVVAAPTGEAFSESDEQTLLEFGELLATAIVSTEERARLSEQALSDPLTGLANPRALRDRLAAELARAVRHGAPLSVAIIDVDHFKEINDNAGHETGDEMLVRVAGALTSFARVEDTLARLGGDEFAWVLPDTTREQALMAVERARRLIAAAPPDPYRITISAGICDTDAAAEGEDLLRLADSALYWSKVQGRNQTWIYDPAVIDQLTEQQRAERLERAQGLQGLRALVRSIESRDPATREHSERVAAVAGQLAVHAGWTREQALALSQAALLHDVGRIASGVAGSHFSLDQTGLAQLREAAALSARVVEPVLSAEQVQWIGGQFAPGSDGAGMMALADAWDTLTAMAPGLPRQVVADLRGHSGTVFSPAAVHALVELYEAGELRDGLGETHRGAR